MSSLFYEHGVKVLYEKNVFRFIHEVDLYRLHECNSSFIEERHDTKVAQFWTFQKQEAFTKKKGLCKGSRISMMQMISLETRNPMTPEKATEDLEDLVDLWKAAGCPAATLHDLPTQLPFLRHFWMMLMIEELRRQNSKFRRISLEFDKRTEIGVWLKVENEMKFRENTAGAGWNHNYSRKKPFETRSSMYYSKFPHLRIVTDQRLAIRQKAEWDRIRANDLVIRANKIVEHLSPLDVEEVIICGMSPEPKEGTSTESIQSELRRCLEHAHVALQSMSFAGAFPRRIGIGSSVDRSLAFKELVRRGNLIREGCVGPRD